jgi:two-component system chemotaxis response regulator CheB
MLLDLELPGRHGFALLERIMRECPVPVLIISGSGGGASQVREQALALGAVGFIQKPDGVTSTHETLQRELARHVEALRLAAARAAVADTPMPALASNGAPASPVAASSVPAPCRAGADRLSAPPAPGPLPSAANGPLIAIGSSTGGIIAVIEVLKRMPAGLAPIMITQHMLPGYAEGFANRIAAATDHRATVARDGEVLRAGSVVVAPSGRHLALRRDGTRLVCELGDQDKISGHRPSCDVLFHSVARVMGAQGIGLILTGMGRDGADGLKAMRAAGARTLGQDEASCVVFGMPRAAQELGATERMLPLTQIGAHVANLVGRAVPEPRHPPEPLTRRNRHEAA